MSSALIDFDKLMEQYDFYNEFTVHDLRYLKKECLPFVEAIPIEWIKKYVAEEGIYPNRELLSVEQADAIERMVENWEKENENR